MLTRVLLPLFLLILNLRPVTAAPFVVTAGQLDEFLIQQGADPRSLSDEMKRKSADKLMEHTLLAQAWQELGIPLTGEQLAELRRLHQDIAVRLARESWTVPRPVSQGDLNVYFELGRFLYHARHILVDRESESKDLHRRLKAGEDFATLAAQHSTDPGSAEKGGYLGPVRTGDTVAEFEDSLFALEPGQFSRPFETPFGWHIVMLDAREPIELERDDATFRRLREQLERKNRRYAEVQARQRLHRHLGVRFDFDSRKPETRVVVSRDTLLTRGELDRLVEQSFSGTISREMLTENLRQAYASHWIETIGWLQVAREEGIWLNDEVQDRIDVHERMLKSALFVSRELVPRIEIDRQDCYNYGDNHPGEFLEFRNHAYRRLVFPTREGASKAREGIQRQRFNPAQAAEAYGETKRQARDRGVVFELTLDERRRLPQSQREALSNLSEGQWSSPVPHGKEFALWLLETRRMPDLDESPALMEAVENTVRTLFLDAEIARVVQELKQERGFDSVQILD